MKKNLIFFVLLISWFGFAQTKKIDSLKNVISTTKSEKEKAVTYGLLSWSLIDTNLKKAISYNDSSFNLCKKIDFKYGVAQAHYKYSVLNRALGNYDKALKHLGEFEKYIEKEKDTLKLANASFQRGVLNSIKGSYDEGLKNYHITLKRYESLNHKRGMGITYNTIGIAYFNMKRYEESIKNYNKSIEILRAINDKDAVASTYTNLANVYDKIEEDDKALEYFNKSIVLSKKTLNIRRIAQNKENIALIFQQRKNYKLALKYSKEAYQTLKKNNYKGEAISAAANLASIYIKTGDFESSEKLLIENLSDVKSSIKNQGKLHKTLFELFEQTNRPKAALIHHKIFKSLSDSIVNENSINNLNKLQVKFESEKKDKEIATQQLQLAQNKTQFSYMAGGALLLLVSSILLWFLYQQRQKRKNQEILTLKREHQVQTLESLMEGEEKERFRIAKELHDGVNGDLSAIKFKLSSLLEMNNTVIKEAVEMIDKSCKQVRAISHNLIPPSLQDFNLVEALEEYCTNMNAIHSPKISFQHLGDKIVLNKKQEANIFRIVQELVNNSIKHAQADKIDVQISSQKDTIQLTVEDNGKGYDEKTIKTDGIGLKNIQSRVAYLNADLDLVSNAQGTSTAIEIDINKLYDN